jgi:hypothetical protein
MPYRGFNDYEILNLVVTGQANACGHGPGIPGALNWIDANSRAIGVKATDVERSYIIENLKPSLIMRLKEDAELRARRDFESQYR